MLWHSLWFFQRSKLNYKLQTLSANESKKLLFASDESHSNSRVIFDQTAHVHQRKILCLAISAMAVCLCFYCKANISSKSILSLAATSETICVGCTLRPLLLNQGQMPWYHVARGIRTCSDTCLAGHRPFTVHWNILFDCHCGNL